MPKLTAGKALRIMNTVLKAPRQSIDRPVAVAICDSGGHLIGMLREEGAPPLLGHIAHAKAFTCVAYGKTPGALAELGDAHPLWFQGISAIAQSKMGAPLAGSQGGVFIKDGRGQTIGAIGVAGETGEQDVALATLGVEAAKFKAET